MRRLVSITAVVLVVALLVTPLAAQQKPLKRVSVQLGWIKNVQFGGLFVADQRGWFAQEGLDVTFIAGGAGIEPINIVRANLTVLAARGKSTATEAEVLVFRPGAAKPSARGRSGARFELQPGVYDVKVVAGADVMQASGQGPCGHVVSAYRRTADRTAPY